MHGYKRKDRFGSCPYPWYVDELAMLPIFLLGVTEVFVKSEAFPLFYEGGIYMFILVLITCACGLKRRRSVQNAIDNSPHLANDDGTRNEVVVANH